MASLTDLVLGLVSLVLWPRLPRDVPGAKYWRAAFAWAAATALIGAVYHGFLTGRPTIGEVTWAVMSTMVVVVMSYLLAAAVVAVLGPSRAVGIIAATGHPSIMAIMYCESVTMACVIGLWIWAALHGHPAGRAMLLAIVVSIAGALFRLIPGASDLLRLDPDSAYHIGQIVGMVLLARAVARGAPAPAGAPTSASEARAKP
jgi:hypothetical protein